jgi:hypothetical protein
MPTLHSEHSLAPPDESAVGGSHRRHGDSGGNKSDMADIADTGATNR